MVVPHYSKTRRSALRVPVLLDENREKKNSNPLAKGILNQLHQATYPHVGGKVTNTGPRKEGGPRPRDAGARPAALRGGPVSPATGHLQRSASLTPTLLTAGVGLGTTKKNT